MNATEWRSQEDAELDFQLKERRQRLFELRFKQAEEMQDTKEVGKVRRDIARILTIQNERRAAAMGATASVPAAPEASMTEEG